MAPDDDTRKPPIEGDDQQGKDARPVPVEGPASPGEATSPDLRAVDVQDDTFIPPDLIDKLKTVAGAEACAMLGIERDNTLRTLQKGTCVLDAVIQLTRSHTPERVFALVKETTAQMGGVFLDAVWSGPGELRIHLLFPNTTQAHDAAFRISEGSSQSSFGAVEGQGYVSTFKGSIFSWGPAFQDAMVLNRGATPGLQMKTRGGSPFKAAFERELGTGEVQQFSQRNVTKESVTHALSLDHLQPGLTKNCVLMVAQIPEYVDGSGGVDQVKLAQVTKIINELLGRGVRVSIKGNLLVVALGIENAPGNTLLRFEKTLRILEAMGMRATLSFGGVTFQQLDENVYAPQSKDIYGVEIPPRPGLWMTEGFGTQKDHPRNRSIARTKDGETARSKRGPLTRIEAVRPIDYEVEIGGPTKTVGRDAELTAIRENVDRTNRTGRCQITIIKGEGGIGKTRLATEAMNAARDKEMPSLYCKQVEEARNGAGAYIRKFIKGILQQYPDLKEDFRDLEFFAEGSVPQGFAKEYAGKVKVLSSLSYLVPRFLKMMERAPELSPGQLILDDLHWLDPFSTKVLVQWVHQLREQSGLNIYVLGREGEDNIPEELLQAIQGKGSMCTEMKVGRLDFASSPELLEDYVRNTPGIREGANIPQSFLQELAAISEGHPFCLTETLESLITNGEITYQGNTMVVDHDAMSRLKKGSLSATMASLLQSKFDRLTTEEREIADYLVIVGDISRELFVSLLRFQFAQQGAKKVESVLGVLDSLRDKGIVRFTPFGFSHDLLRSQREAALGGDAGDLALQSAMAYRPLRMVYHDPKGKDMLTPQMLFGILNRAFERVDVLQEHFTPEAMGELLSEFKSVGREAAMVSLSRNDNENARDILDKLLAKLEATIMSRVIKKPKPESTPPVLTDLGDPEGRRAIVGETNYLFDMYMLAAETFTRLGSPEQAVKYLKKAEALNRLVPDAQVLGSAKGLRYHVLRTKAAFASKSFPELQQARGELRAAHALMAVQAPSDRDTILARGELALADIRLSNDLTQIFHDAAEAKSELGKLYREALVMRDEDLATEVQSLIKDITRATVQKRSHLLMGQNYGIDAEALFMQDLGRDAKAEMAECMTTLERIKGEYEENPYLIRDPQAHGYLYDTIARLKFLVGQHEESHTVLREGVRISRNQGLLEVVARLHKLEGDLTVAGVLKGNFDNPAAWNPDSLKAAVENYQRGIAEVSRVDRNAPYAILCALNEGFAAALYALRLSEEGEQLDAGKRAEVEELLRTEWTQMLFALAHTRQRNLKDGKPTQDYLKELTTLGLLKKAANKLRIQLPFPQQHEEEAIDFLEVKDEEAFLGQQIGAMQESPDSYSDTDRGLVNLRMSGIESIVH